MSKEFEIPNGNIVEPTFDAINIFDHKNFSSFNQTYCITNNTPAALKPTFGNPTAKFCRPAVSRLDCATGGDHLLSLVAATGPETGGGHFFDDQCVSVRR